MAYSKACAHCGCMSDKEIRIFMLENGQVVYPDESVKGKSWGCPVCGHINRP